MPPPVGWHRVDDQVALLVAADLDATGISRNSCGMRTAWLFPFMNTRLTTVDMWRLLCVWLRVYFMKHSTGVQQVRVSSKQASPSRAARTSRVPGHRAGIRESGGFEAGAASAPPFTVRLLSHAPRDGSPAQRRSARSARRRYGARRKPAAVARQCARRAAQHYPRDDRSRPASRYRPPFALSSVREPNRHTRVCGPATDRTVSRIVEVRRPSDACGEYRFAKRGSEGYVLPCRWVP